MRRGDKSDITEVSGMARTLREMFEEDRKAFIDLGVLDEQLGTLGAESYFPRVYDHNAILANRPDFFNRIYAWAKDNPLIPKETKDVTAARGRVGEVAGDSFVSVEEAIAKHVGAKEAAKKAVASLEATRRQRTGAGSALRRAEAAAAEADKNLAAVEAAWGRAEGNAAFLAEKKAAFDKAKEASKAAEAEVATAKKALSEHSAALRKAEREADDTLRELNELEAQREYLPEEASGASPEKLKAMLRALDRRIEKTKVR